MPPRGVRCHWHSAPGRKMFDAIRIYVVFWGRMPNPPNPPAPRAFVSPGEDCEWQVVTCRVTGVVRLAQVGRPERRGAAGSRAPGTPPASTPPPHPARHYGHPVNPPATVQGGSHHGAASFADIVRGCAKDSATGRILDDPTRATATTTTGTTTTLRIARRRSKCRSTIRKSSSTSAN